MLAVTLILGLALGLRLYRIGAEELWLDEVFSFRDATAPGWLAHLRFKDVPPLYPVLLHAWIALAGDGEGAVRLPSALLGTAFVGAIMWAGREMFDARVALWSGLFAALSPIGVYYSQEARPYALLTALVACVYALLWRALRGNTRRQWLAVGVAIAVAMYSHYLAALTILPTAALLGAWPERGRGRSYVGAMALAALLFLPWVVWSFVLTAHPVTGVDWIREAWERTPPLLAIPRSLEVLHLGSQAGVLPITLKRFDDLVYPAALRALGLLGLGLLGLWVAGPWGNRHLDGARPGRRAAALWTLLLFPLVVLWTISWVKPMYVAGRYDQLALPPFALLAGLGLGKLQAMRRVGPLLATLVAVVLVIPVAGKLVLYHRQPARNRERSRPAAEALARRVANGDLVLFIDLRDFPVGYQLGRLGYRMQDDWCRHEASGRSFSCRTFPRVPGAMPAQSDLDRHARSPEVIRADVEEYLVALAGAPASVWVVMGTYAIDAGGLSVSPENTLLLQELGRLGFTPASFDAALGILEYRRRAHAPAPPD